MRPLGGLCRIAPPNFADLLTIVHIKITDVQSFVFNGAPNQHTSMTTGIGVTLELYNATNDSGLNNPLIVFPTQTNAREVYRYDFPSLNPNLSFSTTPSFIRYIMGIFLIL